MDTVTEERLLYGTTAAIRNTLKLIDRALDARNRHEFHRHATHLKVLKRQTPGGAR